MPRKKIIIDTDPGFDDVLALILALGSDALDVRLITTVAGNVGLDDCTANALRVLEAIGASQPPTVHAGCASPLGAPVTRAAHVHGVDGFCGISGRYPVRTLSASPTGAIDAMLNTIRDNPGEMTLIAIGPLTNVATAIEVDAATMGQIKELIVMGGSFGTESNVTAAAEFNFFADAIAARVVIQSGLPITIVGLNVTQQALLPRTRFEHLVAQLSPDTALRSLLGDLTREFFEISKKRRGIDGCYLHDPVAVAAAIDPTLISAQRYPCDIETEGELTQGMLIVDTRPTAALDSSNVKVATAVDVERFIELFEQTLIAAC